MRQALATLLGARLPALMAALLAMTGTAAQAQAEFSPIPYAYPESTSARARPGQPAEDSARETAAAREAEAACNTGSLADCAALGQAYATGAGRPQNRPVAELLYRSACDGAEASGCLRLGDLLRSVRNEAATHESAQAYDRGCRFGSFEACDLAAFDLESGTSGIAGGAPDPQAAEALRRATCAAGSASACRTLAGRLMGSDSSEVERSEGRALIDRQCRTGDRAACEDASSHWQVAEDGHGPRSREYRELACTGGHVWSCTLLGDLAMRDAAGDGGGGGGAGARARGLDFYERACALASFACETAAAIRDEPQWAARCEAGENAACIMLGKVYTESGGPLENQPRALALLGPVCERAVDPAEVVEACELAAARAFTPVDSDAPAEAGAPQDPARTEAYLARACDAGSREGCRSLADELMSGERLPQDMPRALAIYEQLCDADEVFVCELLERQIANDPAAPLVLAGNEYIPDLSDPDTAARLAAEQEAEARATEERRASACTETEVAFRGSIYRDRLCDSVQGVINAFAIRPGEAPWQALLWRPAVLGPRRLTEQQRVLCGGAVIRTGWVLTAAHCLIDEADGVKVPIVSGGHRIRLGLSDPLGDEGYSYPIRRAIPHPDFNRKTLAFDIALVQYDPRGGERAGTVYPIKGIRLDPQPLAARPIRGRMPVFTYGWGATALEGSAVPEQLQGGRLDLRDADSCTQLTKFRGTLQDALLCAAGARGQQACSGDSGGPLVTYGDPGGVPTVIGVVSGGVKCGRTGVPSRFTRIGHARVQTWLDDILPPASRR